MRSSSGRVKGPTCAEGTPSEILAIEDFDRAIQLQPDVLDVYYLRGTAKFKSGDEVGAQRDFQRAKALGF